MAKETSGKPGTPLIGLLALKNHLLTRQDLQTALSRCSGSPDITADLKKYLLSNDLISKKNMDRLTRAAKAINLRKKEYRFGTIAVKKGFINKSVLKLALEEQQQGGCGDHPSVTPGHPSVD